MDQGRKTGRNQFMLWELGKYKTFWYFDIVEAYGCSDTWKYTYNPVATGVQSP